MPNSRATFALLMPAVIRVRSSSDSRSGEGLFAALIDATLFGQNDPFPLALLDQRALELGLMRCTA